MEIIEYKIDFIYDKINEYVWSDNFQLSEEWEILRLKKTRTLQKSYMDRSPYTEPNTQYTIALYSQNKWYCLHNGKGNVISPLRKNPEIPNLKIIKSTFTPFLTIYKIQFDFHVMMTLLNLNDEIKVLEFKRPSLTEGIIIYNKMKINVYNSLFSYKGENQKEFKLFCINTKKMYEKDSPKIIKLYSKISFSDDTHKSIDFRTWYKAKRENQQEWPKISKIQLENSIEFPKNSNIWYYYPQKFVGLARRNDDNPLQLIPKIYKKDHSKNKNTNLYHYLQTGKPKNDDTIKIPHTLRKGDLKYAKQIKKLTNEKYIEMSYNGEIIETDKNPEYYMYRNILIKKTDIKINIDLDAQLLNQNNERIMILKNNKWIKSQGPRIKNIITIPWNYKQILHDYNKLGRLKKGKIIDLSNIGIVDENATDIITWPETENLYSSKTLETQRLITFKFQKNVKIKVIYD
uniref:S.kluyveri linear plasmid pSKL DNA for open reading frames 1-10 n=1 Tax=Lachancea kluyveri TaxID=4934 RepID=Q04331_LACKL|nr:unnamed protein product [Lachancea kluyveri]prf//1712308J ORF 9 [Lachancea kluyveri]